MVRVGTAGPSSLGSPRSGGQRSPARISFAPRHWFRLGRMSRSLREIPKGSSLAEHRVGRAWVWNDQSQTAPTDALRTVPVSIRAESEAKRTAVLAVSAVLGL